MKNWFDKGLDNSVLVKARTTGQLKRLPRIPTIRCNEPITATRICGEVANEETLVIVSIL